LEKINKLSKQLDNTEKLIDIKSLLKNGKKASVGGAQQR
jgi:hypothetical protein